LHKNLRSSPCFLEALNMLKKKYYYLFTISRPSTYFLEALKMLEKIQYYSFIILRPTSCFYCTTTTTQPTTCFLDYTFKK
jgi:hypothetical protein